MKEVTENKQLMEERAYQYLGEIYVKLPRSILNIFFHPDEWQQKVGRVYLYLYGRCAFQQNTVRIGKYSISCSRGEYVGTYRALSEHTGVPLSTVHRVLKDLAGKGLICLEQVPGGTRIYLYGYDRYNSTLNTRKDSAGERAHAMAELEQRLENGQVYV